KAPPGFRYSVKANRFITHLKKLLGCEEEIDRFIGLARRLEDKLGPILYQLPPSLHKDLARLEALLKRLPSDLEHVVEFRHRSWKWCWCYFNNDIHGHAIEDARTLKSMVGQIAR